MKNRFMTLTSLAILLGLLLGAFPGATVQAAGQLPMRAQAGPPSPALAPAALANATYISTVSPTGTVTLTDGQYEDTENRYIAVLAPEPTAYGLLNEVASAAVLLGENGGGSGIFVTLEIMQEQDGAPVAVASTLLGDRTNVTSLAIADNQVVVEMITQGPNDPMCCPTQWVRQSYTLDGDQLTLVNQETLGSVPYVSVGNAPDGYTTTVAPPTPYDNSLPPVPTGAPLHTVIAFGEDEPATAAAEGKPFIAVYPTQAYAQLWADAGDMTVQEQVAALEQLLAERSTALQPPLPILPPAPATNDLAAQIQFLDGQGFSGLRFIGRVAQDASPVTGDQLRYYFTGLTDDGAHVIAAQWPVSSAALPPSAAEIPADVLEAATADPAAYLAGVAETLNSAGEDGWSTAPSALDAIVTSLSITTGDAGLTPETLANMPYQSYLKEGESVLLVSGVYTEPNPTGDGAPGLTVTLVEQPMAFGTIDGVESAAVLIAENGGGSGVFVSLALVQNVVGTPTNVATSLLGDRVNVSNLAITPDGIIVVDMVAQGPNDPMCCPTMPTTVAYAYIDGQLVMVGTVAATIDAANVSTNVSAAIVQATAYDNTMPPSGQGEPKHAVWSLDGTDAATVQQTFGAYVAIYSVPAFQQIWRDAGDPLVAETLTQLNVLLTTQPENPQPPLPMLPPMPASNDIGAQVGYLDLADGGVGMRWIGRLTQSADPVLDSQLRYFFQGLTGDGQRLIVASVPVTTGVLPADISAVPAEQMDMSASDYEAYMAEVQSQLNALAPADFTATLDALDAMMQSVTVMQYANPLLPDALANLEYFSTLAPEGKVQLTDGQYEDTANSIFVSFVAQPIAYGMLNEQSAAAVLIAENGGGSGVFVNLEVVLEQELVATTVASIQLGDRVSVNHLTIVDNQIVVDMVTQGPNDPMCCPTQQVTQVYELQDDQLVLVSETKAEAASASPLAGTAWVWTGTTQNDAAITTPAQPAAFVLTFNADGTLSAQTDCNTRLGAYSEGPNFGLTITLGISTMMACPPESQEEIFAEQLGQTLSYVLIDAQLSLAIGDGAFMEFTPASTAAEPADSPATSAAAPDAALTANPWNWTRTAMNDDSVKEPAQAGAFVLTLGADGSASTTTDCNTFNGQYTTDADNRITITLPISTRMACPEGAQEAAYIQDLTSVQFYLLQDGNLFLQLPFDSGTIDYAPAQ